MEYADIAVAVLVAFALAWIADEMTGKRGLFATSLVSGVGAACGWFLGVRVFNVVGVEGWMWVAWALGGSVFCLVTYFLFRSKR